MKVALSLDDVLLSPKFSFIKSRKDVDPSVELCGLKLTKALISSNMDTVTGVTMAKAMREAGAIGCLHRFWTIEENVKAFQDSPNDTWVSVGLGDKELERANKLLEAGAKTFVIDVAHGASIEVVNQTKAIRELIGEDKYLVVGNFATNNSIQEFKKHLGNVKIDAIKVNVGSGSACLTRIVTGCGLPSFESIVDCVKSGYPVIQDGGIKNSGDYAKALAAGATAVMCGKLFAGTDESPTETLFQVGKDPVQTKTQLLSNIKYEWFHMHEDKKRGTTFEKFQERVLNYTKVVGKKYRGSASNESYEVQGKLASHRSYEGDSFLVPYVGSVVKVLEQMDAGLRSAMSYCNATTIKELQENANFIEVTNSGVKESSSHGRS